MAEKKKAYRQINVRHMIHEFTVVLMSGSAGEGKMEDEAKDLLAGNNDAAVDLPAENNGGNVAGTTDAVCNNVFISTVLDAGSQSNLNPQLLVDAFLAWKGLEDSNINVEIQRQNLYFD